MFSIFGFYKFKKLNNLKKNKSILQLYMSKHQAKGAVIIAKEGINGTISGNSVNISYINKTIRSSLKFSKFDSENLSKCMFQPFHKPRVKIKKEVVPMGLKIALKVKKDNHLTPSKWNNFIKNKNTFVLDARKSFEYEVGTFNKSINPKVNHFREFPKYLNKLNKKKPIAMFCTGGIRCEKASSYMLKNGYKDISQLDGGILNYLEVNKKTKSTSWKGECFVFDNRVAVNSKLDKGTYEQCYGCRQPITKRDMKLKSYKKGATCKYCINLKTKTKIQSSSTRQSQIDIAEKNNTKHSFRKIYTSKLK